MIALAFFARTQFLPSRASFRSPFSQRARTAALLLACPHRSGAPGSLRDHLTLFCFYVTLLVAALSPGAVGTASAQAERVRQRGLRSIASTALPAGVGTRRASSHSGWGSSRSSSAPPGCSRCLSAVGGERRHAFACVRIPVGADHPGVVSSLRLDVGTFVIDRFLFYLAPVLLLGFVCALLDERRPRWSLSSRPAAVSVGFATPPAGRLSLVRALPAQHRQPDCDALQADCQPGWRDDRSGGDSHRSRDARARRGSSLLLARVVHPRRPHARLRRAASRQLPGGYRLHVPQAVREARPLGAAAYPERERRPRLGGPGLWGPGPASPRSPTRRTRASSSPSSRGAISSSGTSRSGTPPTIQPPTSTTMQSSGSRIPRSPSIRRRGTRAIHGRRTSYKSVTETRFRIAGNVQVQGQTMMLIDADRPWRTSWLTYGLYDDGWTKSGAAVMIRVFAYFRAEARGHEDAHLPDPGAVGCRPSQVLDRHESRRSERRRDERGHDLRERQHLRPAARLHPGSLPGRRHLIDPRRPA